MIENLENLAKRIRNEVNNLERMVKRIQEEWKKSKLSTDESHLDSVTLNLQGFYSGLERLFELIVASSGETKVEGPDWHRQLLDQMSSDIPQIRPAIISEETRESLDAFRSFRHLSRNVYPFTLVPERMEKLIEDVPDLFRKVSRELLAFANFLERKARQKKK